MRGQQLQKAFANRFSLVTLISGALSLVFTFSCIIIMCGGCELIKNCVKTEDDGEV